MSPVMARCRHSWPIAECTVCAPPAMFAPATPPDDRDPHGVVIDDAPPATVAITIGGIAALGYVALGATFILLGRVAWHAVRALTGG